MEVNINQDEFLMDTESIALEGNIIWKMQWQQPL
jgi:hypothetical protein